MRNLLIAFTTLFCVAGVSACDDTSNNIKLPDLAMKDAAPVTPPADLSLPMTGCNGYLSCLGKAMTTADQTACDNNATANAMTLEQAFNTCLVDACLNMNDDGGTPFCSSGSDTSAKCSNCIKAAIKGTCASSLAACRADKP